jgi:hypothetical protein
MRHLRRLLLSTALAVALVPVVAPATPAQARSSSRICQPIYHRKANFVEWICINLTLDWRKALPECRCPDRIFDLGRRWTLPVEDRRLVLTHLANGLTLTEQAIRIGAGDRADELRREALGEFVASAEGLRDQPLEVSGLAAADVAEGQFYRIDAPWLEAAGSHVAEGLDLTRAALDSPDPDALLERAMALFEQSFAHLAEGQIEG